MFSGRTAIVDDADDAGFGLRIGHADMRAERQGAMGRGEALAVSRIKGTKSGEIMGAALRVCLHRESSRQERRRNSKSRSCHVGNPDCSSRFKLGRSNFVPLRSKFPPPAMQSPLR